MVEAEKHVLQNEKHPNGVLGLWLSNVPESCIAFGPYVYETEIGPARVGIVPYEELFGWHRFTQTLNTLREQVDWYKAKRLELLATMDVAYIQDRSTQLGEIIVLNLEVITKHQRTESWQKRPDVRAALNIPLTTNATETLEQSLASARFRKSAKA